MQTEVGQTDKEYLRLLAEQVRRKEEEGLRYYRPWPAQLGFHQSQAEVRLLSASNQFGKSWAEANEMAMSVGKVHPWRKNFTGPVYGRHCCKDFQVMMTTVIPTYRRILPRKPCEVYGRQWPGLRGGTWESAWSSEGRAIFLADGSFIEFKSYDQDVMSYAGPPRHIIAHDEEPPQPIYNENVARQATLGRNILFAFTPLNYSQWLFQLKEQAATDPRIAIFEGSMYDNPMIARETIKSIEESIEDPAERAARVYGKFTYQEGLVWKGYGDHNVCEPFSIPDLWHKTVVIDPHPEKATAALCIAESEKGVGFVCWEGEFKGDVEHICNSIKVGLGGKQVNTWLIDPSSRQSAGIYGKGRLIDEFRRFIPWIIEANNDRELGWEAVRQRVKNDPQSGPRLKVFRSCPMTDFQMRNYSWKVPLASGESRSKPEVIKKHDEFPDCVRYWALYARTSWAGESFEGFDIRALA